MHTPLILAVVAFGLTCYTLARVYSKQKDDLKFQRESLEHKLIGESSKIQEEVRSLKQCIETLQLQCNALQLQAQAVHSTHEMIKEMYSEEVEEAPTPKLPPANRKPRTEEQKRLAAEQKKAWWAAKRAKEEEEKRAQEQNVPTLPVIGESLNEPLVIPS